MELNANPQPDTADFLQVGAAKGLQEREEVGSHFRRASTSFSSTRTRRAVRATAQPSGFPPNVLPWSQGLYTPRISFEDRHRRDGIEAASESFADDEDVKPYTLVHVGKEPASASQARLDFIRHQQDPVLAAEFSRLFQESRGRDHDSQLRLAPVPPETRRCWG
jgi:hypothetical protein